METQKESYPKKVVGWPIKVIETSTRNERHNFQTHEVSQNLLRDSEDYNFIEPNRKSSTPSFSEFLLAERRRAFRQQPADSVPRLVVLNKLNEGIQKTNEYDEQNDVNAKQFEFCREEEMIKWKQNKKQVMNGSPERKNLFPKFGEEKRWSPTHQITQSQQLGDLRRSLGRSQQENKELREALASAKDSEAQLKAINESLLIRMRELEASYRCLRADLEEKHLAQQRHIEQRTFSSVQNYISRTLTTFLHSLRIQRMTPRLQAKLEDFFAQLLHLNSVTVRNCIKLSPSNSGQKQLLNGNFNTQSKDPSYNIMFKQLQLIQEGSFNHDLNIGSRSISKSPDTKEQSQSAIKTHSNRVQRLSDAVEGEQWPQGSRGWSPDHRAVRRIKQDRYSTTPERRRKIFQ